MACSSINASVGARSIPVGDDLIILVVLLIATRCGPPT
jgi:hypothetical protein